MVWRSITTLGIWLTIAGIASVLINSIRYAVSTVVDFQEFNIPNLEQLTYSPIFNTTYEMMPQSWQITVGVMLIIMLIGATLATMAIWMGSSNKSDSSKLPARINTEITSAKQKRDQQARLKRLLEKMDDEEVADALAALEMNRSGTHLSDDGEQMSVGELLAQNRRGN